MSESGRPPQEAGAGRLGNTVIWRGLYKLTHIEIGAVRPGGDAGS